MQTPEIKPGKNEFKCYNCRLVFVKRDGNWFDWGSMQVHLCRRCDKATAEQPQRKLG